MTYVAITVALVLLSGTGCGTDEPAGDREEIEAVVKRNMVAVVEGDSKTYCALLTGKALGQPIGRPTRAACERRQGEIGKGTAEEAAEVSKLKVTAVKADGDRASVKFSVDGQSVPMELTRVEGKWLISDIDPTGVGAEVAEGIEKAERSQQTAKDLDCSTFRFDADEWRRAANDSVETPTRRQRLADALLKCRTLIGKGENELTELLGRPDDYVAAKDQRSWVTGTERSYFAIDHEHLVAEFDHSGEVGSVELATD